MLASRSSVWLWILCACAQGTDDAAPPVPEPDVPLPADVASVVDPLIAAARERPPSGGDLRRLGMAYEANGRDELAFAAYERAVALDATDARAAYHLARMQHERGDYDAALASIARVHELAPSYGPAWRRHGDWLFESGRLDEAETSYRRAFERDRDAASALAWARLELERGDAEEAARLASEVARAAPQIAHASYLWGKALVLAGREDEAEPLLARFDGSPPPDPDPWQDEVDELAAGYHALMEEARALVGAGRGDAALALLERAFDENPDDVTMQSMLCAAYVDAGRFDDALSMLRAALERQPDHYRIVMNLAIVERARGRLDVALEHARRAVELHSGHAHAWDLYGRIATALDLIPEAIRAYEGAVRCGGDDQARYLLRLGVRQLADERVVDASESFARVIELLPHSSAGYLGRAEARARAGDVSGARADLERARELDPGNERIAKVERLLTEIGAGR